MDSRDITKSEDYAATVPLEISNEVASRADDLLREFAEDSGLETALIVDRSGALVAGISAEADVTIEVISALVAGASGAMRALVSQLGESGAMESLHLGGDRMVYLREIVNRFILVGVARATSPAGLVRSKAHLIEGHLTELLRDIKPVEATLSPPVESVVRSLREVALRRAAERLVIPQEAVASEPEPDDIDSIEDIDPTESDDITEQVIFEDDEIDLEFEPIFEPEPFIDLEPLPIIAPVPVEPREILEPLDFGEAEVVFEVSTASVPPMLEKPELPLDSPFEVEMDEVDDKPTAALPSESVFELESFDEEEDDDEIEEDEFDPSEPEPPASFFELIGDEDDEDEEAPEVIFETDEDDEDDEDDENDDSEAADLSDLGADGPESESVEENIDSIEPERAGDSLFEVADEDSDENDEESEDIAEEIQEMIAEEEEESEVRSSGPFYF